MLTQIGTSIGVAIISSLIIYAKKLTKEGGEEFDVQKLIRAIVIGGILGVGASQGDYDITQGNWESYVAANAGIILIADQILTGVWRFVRSKKS